MFSLSYGTWSYYNAAHRWFYVPDMQADEAILIK
jgi:hypothetical protein